MSTVTITVHNKEVATKLHMLTEMMGSEFLAWFLDVDVVQILQEQTDKRFEEEGSDVGEWEELAEATGEIRESLGFQPFHPINERTGELRDWITSTGGFSAPAASFGAIMNWPDELPGDPELYTKYRTAQEGKSVNDTPARPVVAIVAEDVVLSMSALAAHFSTAGVVWM